MRSIFLPISKWNYCIAVDNNLGKSSGGAVKVTFVYPDIIGDATYTGQLYFGIGFLSAMLKKSGHTVSLVHITQPTSNKKMLSMFEEHEADLYGFTSSTHMIPWVKKWTKALKNDIDRPVIVGGIHATLFPDEVISEDSIDYVCIGEGEYLICELCDALEKGKDVSPIQNLCWKDEKGHVRKNNLRPLVADLDSLPFADRTIFRYKELESKKRGMTYFMFSRGCPNSCAYCCIANLRRVYKELGRYVRVRSVGSVIREMKEVLEKHDFIKELAICDDILPGQKDWLEEFAHHYHDEIGIPFRCKIRPEMITQETARLLAWAGCTHFNVGVETGNEKLRKEILKRTTDDKSLSNASKACKDNNIKLFTFNMVGVPHENVSDMLSTIKINAKIGTDFPKAFVFYPYPGTELHEVCKKEGLLTDRSFETVTESSTLKYDYLTLTRISFFRNLFIVLMKIYKFIYARNEKVSKILEHILDTCLSLRILCFTFYPMVNGFIRVTRKSRLYNRLLKAIKGDVLYLL